MPIIRKLCLYYHTLKYLKFKQIYYRLYYKIFSIKVNQSIPELNLNTPVNQWTPSLVKRCLYFKENNIVFLNQECLIKESDFWNDASKEKLWLYNLHYFDALHAGLSEQQEKAYELLVRWEIENPPFIGNGWEPYPISLRLVNIFKYILNGHVVSNRLLKSAYLQARFLRKKCEFHLLGNHLFENLKALCFAGILFKTKEAKEWFSFSMKHLKKQIKEQILSDGGHFELSPMYHGIILEGMLDLYNLFTAFKLPFKWCVDIKKMLTWLSGMQRPNDEYSHFNDSTNGVAPKPSELFSYANLLALEFNEIALGATLLESSGYFIYSNDRIKMIIDTAKIGPDYLPGHAHADILSFELYVNNLPVLVNSGISCYDGSTQRQYERSTKAHNAVEVGGIDSCEMWGNFRVARRVYPKVPKVSVKENTVKISCRYRGLRRFFKAYEHERVFIFTDKHIQIVDTVSKTKRPILLRFHLHPNCQYDNANNETLLLSTNSAVSCTFEMNHEFYFEALSYAFGFYRKKPSKVVCAKIEPDNAVVTSITYHELPQLEMR